MDSITDKFSVFDFFNYIIGGFVFWLGLGICNYSQAMEFSISIASVVGDSDFLLFVTIVLFIGCSLVTGTVINEIANWIFNTKLQWEKNLIDTCLNKSKLIKNEIKLDIFRKKANDYLDIDVLDINEDYSIDQCSTYFAYCVYYLHVRGLDKKTEKLRETQGLSELLTLVFASVPISSIIIQILSGTTCLNIKPFFYIYALFALCACAFLRRTKRAMENRIKMVLAVYDACVNMKDCKD